MQGIEPGSSAPCTQQHVFWSDTKPVVQAQLVKAIENRGGRHKQA